MEFKFIVNNNVGKLAKWLRVIGYDTLVFKQKDDNRLIKLALSENRVILTRDTQIMKRRLVTSGKLRATLITEDDPKAQLRQTVKTLNLDYHFRPFSLCLECNQPLISQNKEEVRDLIPPHVFKTQNQYAKCPICHRVYWQGTHWQAMIKELEIFTGENSKDYQL